MVECNYSLNEMILKARDKDNFHPNFYFVSKGRVNLTRDEPGKKTDEKVNK
jgi:hypothetical protein